MLGEHSMGSRKLSMRGKRLVIEAEPADIELDALWGVRYSRAGLINPRGSRGFIRPVLLALQLD